MQVPQWLVDFWNANGGNIIASLSAGVVFFVLGPIGLWFSGRRIRQERRRKAKEALLDLLEGMLVNQESLDEPKIASLFRAVERDVDVDLGGSYSIDDSLDDLTLRFEKSKHLDAAQKNRYSSQIRDIHEQVVKKAEKPKEVAMPRAYAPILAELTDTLEGADTKTASSLVDELKRRLVRERSADEVLPSIFRIYRRFYDRNPVQFTFIAVMVLIAYVYILFIFLRAR